MTRFKTLAIILVLASTFGPGCSGSKVQVQVTPQITISPTVTNIQMGATYNIRIANSGDGDLIVSGFEIGGDTCTGGGFAFSVDLGEAELPVTIAPPGSEGDVNPMWFDIVVRHDDPSQSCPATATLTISSNDPTQPRMVLQLTRTSTEPNIIAEPNPLDLGFVPVGTIPASDYILVQNTGLDDLEITKLEVIPLSEGFSFTWPCVRNPDTSVTAPWGLDPDSRITVSMVANPADRLVLDGDVCLEPLIVKPAESLSIPVFYTAIAPNPAKAEFRFHSNDPDYDSTKGDAYTVTVQANMSGPCIQVLPNPIEFGSNIATTAVKGVPVVITNCGDEPLEITSIRKEGDNCAEFSFDLTGTGEFDSTHPLVIQPGVSISIIAKYTPVDISPKDSENMFIPDECLMVVDNNSARQSVEIPMSGVGTEAECAVCQFVMMEGGIQLGENAQVLPQVVIEMVNHSYDPTIGGGIKSYNWTVKQPGESAQVFNPTSTWDNPTFQPNVVGDYEFCLEVFNNDGCSDSCCKSIEVVPPEGLHIELTWNTPSDPDQTDQCGPGVDCGADLDLHIVHPLAGQGGMTLDPETGSPYGFFDPTWDCVGWSNPHPVWDKENQGDPLYQPNFDLDDTDGAGPENFTYTRPDPKYSTTNPNCYKVGVHYYDDHTFGKSYPTVKIFINGEEPISVTLGSGMSMLDMWDVGRVCYYGSPVFVERKNTNGSPHIIPNYAVPWF